MPETSWRLGPMAALDDTTLIAAIEARFRQIYQAAFVAASCHHGLPIQVRALRGIEDWRVMLLLTPWMLSRLFLPCRPPQLALPMGWSAEERCNAGYVVIGSALTFSLSGGSQRAHINYDIALGHYLMQPLAQAMQDYHDADAVFSAWNDVIATRDRVMAEQGRNCPWQQGVSRREWFSRLLRGKC